MHHSVIQVGRAKRLAIALAVMAYEAEYGIVANGNFPMYKCGKAIYLWTTNEGDRWSFSYHWAGRDEEIIDYTNTLNTYSTKEEAEAAMAGLVWALNGARGEYPR